MSYSDLWQGAGTIVQVMAVVMICYVPCFLIQLWQNDQYKIIVMSHSCFLMALEKFDLRWSSILIFSTLEFPMLHQ